MKSTIKSISLFALLVGGGVATASAETLWVTGVSESGGWYDANKPVDSDKNYFTAMSGHCHTATAANLVAWWQDQYVNIPAAAATGDDVWQTYCDNTNNQNAGGNAHEDVKWWISGSGVDYFDTISSPYSSFDIGADSLNSFASWNNKFSGTTVSDYLKEAISAGKGIGITVTDGWSHDITVWGVNTNDSTGVVCGLWLTDSDDGKAVYSGTTAPSLFYVEVVETTEEWDNQLHTTLQIVDSNLSDTMANSDHGLGGAHIYNVYTVDPTVSDAWGLVRYSAVPEPATATLSLVGLAALAMRRRRK